ncbi:DMT family transporter [Thioclava dalianensis]|uniref:DMT family transporter n=1 Tax=Thioclava dalianensis TaxID=1185766 RepID=UPI000AE56102
MRRVLGSWVIVLLLARGWLGTPLSRGALGAAVLGLVGVALLVLQPHAKLDPLGVGAALIGAGSMAAGVVLTRRWQPPVPALTFTAWQLTAGGLLLAPLAFALEPALPPLSVRNIAGFLWLGLFGAAISYFFWFRGIARLGPAAVTSFGFLSPLSAVVLGWLVLGERLGRVQTLGALIVLGSVWLAGRINRGQTRIAPPTTPETRAL